MSNKEIFNKQLDEYFEKHTKEQILKELKEKGSIIYKENNAGPYKLGFEIEITNLYKYNPDYGDNKLCQCGHPYTRHFDSYDDMDPVGCKYCICRHFEEKEVERKEE